MTMSRSEQTKKAILDAAERLFVNKGHEGSSMRDITQLANVNLAAVNYHFGSKDELIIAVMKRRLGSINAERLRQLDALETEAAGDPLKPSHIVNAFFGSLLSFADSDDPEGGIFLRLLEQTMLNPSAFIAAVVAKENATVVHRYKEALYKSLPDVPKIEILWRLQFMLGATSYALHGIRTLIHATDQNELGEEYDLKMQYDSQLKPRLLSFILGGLRAPLPEFN